MNISEAEREGVKAFNVGRGSEPALNQSFLIPACSSCIDTAKLLEAYTHGYTIANLAYLSSDIFLPSKVELKRITG